MQQWIWTLSILCLGMISPKGAERLELVGKEIHYQGKPIYLRGANTIAQVGKISEQDAQNFQNMGMNFVRLLLDVDTKLDLADSEGDGDYIQQSAIDEWKTVSQWFTTRKIWVNLELRSNDFDLDTSGLWKTQSPLHHQFKQIWKKLARTFHSSDYIATYGLLAEHGQGKVATMKSTFGPIMAAIDSIDGKTPFSFGPKLNSIDYYDYSKYPDLYWPEYQNRILYQINHLHPKPFINKDPAKGYNPETWWYHRTDGQDGEGADNDGSMNKAGTLNHLKPALSWRDHYLAPIYIDQWGCDFSQPGYMDYERDMLEIFTENGMIANTRWTYYMSGSRAIMNDVNGKWELHQPLFDFFKSSNQGLIWPYETNSSEPWISDNRITTDGGSAQLPWNIDYEFSAPFISNKIELWSNTSLASEDPKDIEIYGSAEGINWNLITTLKNLEWSQRNQQWISPSFENSKAYRYYRAKVLSNHGGLQTTLSGLEFFPSGSNSGLNPVTQGPKRHTLSYDPLSQSIHIDLSPIPNTEAMSYAIFNLRGEILRQSPLRASGHEEIQVGPLPPGLIYILLKVKNQPIAIQSWIQN